MNDPNTPKYQILSSIKLSTCFFSRTKLALRQVIPPREHLKPWGAETGGPGNGGSEGEWIEDGPQ